ncbi:PREDICTED: uncharacterized protein LOC104699275 [Camelina sativa]|uniref:Uncharacterized protein LOC104699275 n=1 Tax=Camelina sativa TaxID=90675 RepID=A0ABM0SLC0_CAMSA|nr:PREDICTED: uncharacterized protein LOC104699275 [Camelina sativa]
MEERVLNVELVEGPVPGNSEIKDSANCRWFNDSAEWAGGGGAGCGGPGGDGGTKGEGGVGGDGGIGGNGGTGGDEGTGGDGDTGSDRGGDGGIAGGGGGGNIGKEREVGLVVPGIALDGTVITGVEVEDVVEYGKIEN